MVNTVLDSITTTLYTTFGDSYHYYVEDTEQASKLPCFTIDVLNPLSRSVNKKDYYRTIPCVIHYFTNNKTTTTKECYSIGEKVLDCLEYINIGERIVRGEDMSYTMVDDVLQIFITYHFWTEKNTVIETDMETLDHPETKLT